MDFHYPPAIVWMDWQLFEIAAVGFARYLLGCSFWHVTLVVQQTSGPSRQQTAGTFKYLRAASSLALVGFHFDFAPLTLNFVPLAGLPFLARSYSMRMVSNIFWILASPSSPENLSSNSSTMSDKICR